MHELGIIEDLISAIQAKLSGKKDIKQVKKVYLRLGKSSGLTDEILKFWFGRLSQGTLLEGAALEFCLTEGREIIVDSLDVE